MGRILEILKMTFLKMQRVVYLSLLLSTVLYHSTALAYIGPGLGSGVVAAVLGIVAGLVMLVIGVVWYPLKRLIRKIKRK